MDSAANLRPCFVVPAIGAFQAAGRMLLLTCWISASLGAQTSEPGALGTSVFGERIDIQVINVDVLVTDRDGRPVPGLTRDDFEIFDDGQPVEITNFYADAALVSASGPAAPDLSGPTAVPADRPNTLAFFFDNLHLRPASRKRVLQGLSGFLKENPERAPGMAIAVPDGAGFQILHPFGGSLKTARTALKTLASMPARGIHADNDHRTTLAYMRDIWETLDEVDAGRVEPCGWGLDQQEAAIRNYSQAVAARVERTLSSLGKLIDSLAPLAGQKTLVYISDGLEFTPGSDLLHYLNELCPQQSSRLLRVAEQRDLRRRFETLTRNANGDQVTLYTLDAPGLRSSTSMLIGDIDNPRFLPSATFDTVRRANLQNSLTFVAEETGGRALLGLNRFAEALGAIAQESGSLYSLGFQAAPGEDGEDGVRPLKVRVKDRPGLKLHYRRTYRAKSPEERLADRALGALFHGLHGNPLGLEVRRGAARRNKGNRFLVPIQLSVPLDRLTLLEDAGLHLGRLRLVLISRDREQTVSPVRQNVLDLRLTPKQLALGSYSFGFDLEMREGQHAVAFALQDEVSRETSYLLTRLTVGGAS